MDITFELASALNVQALRLADEKQVNIRLTENGQLQTEVMNTEPQIVNVDINQNRSLDEVPAELKQRFNSAVEATELQVPVRQVQTVVRQSSLPDISMLAAQEQAELPKLRYQMHIYASEPSERWIKINDQVLTEGDWLGDQLRLLEIRQQLIVWENSYSRFSQEALQDHN